MHKSAPFHHKDGWEHLNYIGKYTDGMSSSRSDQCRHSTVRDPVLDPDLVRLSGVLPLFPNRPESQRSRLTPREAGHRQMQSCAAVADPTSSNDATTRTPTRTCKLESCEWRHAIPRLALVLLIRLRVASVEARGGMCAMYIIRLPFCLTPLSLRLPLHSRWLMPYTVGKFLESCIFPAIVTHIRSAGTCVRDVLSKWMSSLPL